ncbi:hypothetical protein SIN8267_01423 [Sinobacterium norvegicum]|uniref:N-acetyltransferase domain-containing protein n=2 Tax=Sinobacterium norvegicum TaxID=1641715 RepID=A0ABN8EJK3_9GAMM|nr:hypothetical protein SIN8267_01423 [Sinobacterium norvegicum]
MSSQQQDIQVEFYINTEQPAGQAAEELIDFWLSTNALPDRETAVARLSQVVAVARHQGHVGSVMSGYVGKHELIGQPLFHLRSFTDKRYRRTGLGLSLLMAVKQRFEQLFDNDNATMAIGLCLSLEGSELLSAPALRQGVWQRSGFVFVGRNSRGLEQRVYYFKGATLR